MIALLSAKGSPGVTCAGLALALAAPGRCLLAECDPAGGDVLAGYLQGDLAAGRGLAPLAVAGLRARLAGEFDSQLVDLHAPHRRRLLLPGVSDPAQSATVASVWQQLAEHLYRWREPDRRVVVDCGRYTDSHFGWPLVRRADRVLLVLRPTLPSVAAAVPAIRMLREELAERAERLALLVTGAGPYPPGQVARRLAVPLAGRLPADPRAAARLSFGGTVHQRMPLLRAAAMLHRSLAAPPAPAPAAAEQEVSGV
jgi:hypothetical protein